MLPGAARVYHGAEGSMIVQSIEVRGETYQVGDRVVFNNIVSFDNEFNGEIIEIQTRKNSHYPILSITHRLGRTVKTERIKSYMLIRKGNDGKGLDWDYD